MTKPARPSVKRDPSLNFLNPDTNFIKLLERAIEKEEPTSEGKRQNEYVGVIEYRVVGTTTTVTTKEALETADPSATSKVGRVKNAFRPGLDINYIVADPFYDRNIDETRVSGRGKLDYSQIQDRVSLFLYSEGLYHVLFPRKKIVKDIAEIQILEEEIIASFLLRVNFDKSQYGGINSNKKQKFIFKFNDRDNLREPELVKHIPRTSQAGTKEKRS